MNIKTKNWYYEVEIQQIASIKNPWDKWNKSLYAWTKSEIPGLSRIFLYGWQVCTYDIIFVTIFDCENFLELSMKLQFEWDSL